MRPQLDSLKEKSSQNCKTFSLQKSFLHDFASYLERRHLTPIWRQMTPLS
jgi:hypothetical protein